MTECTGLSAVWCPVCGDCTCPTRPDGSRYSLDSEDCPLHSPRSKHADEGEPLEEKAARELWSVLTKDDPESDFDQYDKTRLMTLAKVRIERLTTELKIARR